MIGRVRALRGSQGSNSTASGNLRKIGVWEIGQKKVCRLGFGGLSVSFCSHAQCRAAHGENSRHRHKPGGIRYWSNERLTDAKRPPSGRTDPTSRPLRDEYAALVHISRLIEQHRF